MNQLLYPRFYLYNLDEAKFTLVMITSNYFTASGYFWHIHHLLYSKSRILLVHE